jgi:hypothetical protein
MQTQNGHVVDVRISGATTPGLEILPALSPDEATELQRCEEQVKTHLRSYFEAAKALKTIHDRRLYRSDYSSWEAYVEDRLGMQRAYAHRLVRSANYIEVVLLPLGNVPLPENESQVRPITVLPPDKARKAWKEVAKKAKASKLTAKLVSRVVTEMFPREAAKQKLAASATQQHILKFLSQAMAAAAKGEFDAALQHLSAAQVRIEAERIRSASRED